jgi:hypothetical protein
MLNNSHFIKTCTENYLSMARRFYLQGLIVSRSNKFGLPPPLESLNEAYELIKDEIVTELTWKVLYELSENYLLRGNINKANDFLYYSKEVIKFIADSIKNFDLKLKYLSKTERKVVIEK